MNDLEELVTEARAAIGAVSDSTALDAVRVDYLGKKGKITALLKGLGKLSAAERPAAGAQINIAKQRLQEQIGDRKAVLQHAALAARLASEKIDVTLPGRG